MRVITGAYRGRRIVSVNDLSVRPATERVRQTIFNMLVNRMELEGARVLDLFAGTGSLGLECLSRGASAVVFVEQSRRIAGCIERSLAEFGCSERGEVLTTDVMDYLAGARDQFDLAFCDPPYSFPHSADLPRNIMEGGLLRGDGYLVMEHAHSLRFESGPKFLAGPEKKFGRTLITFFQPPHPERTHS
jgi:16S rRNA (guanine966-N2)-methyltransferase